MGNKSSFLFGFKGLWFIFPTLFIFLPGLCLAGNEINIKLPDSSTPGKSHLRARDFKKNIEGKMTQLFILKNRNGIQAGITNYGARLVGLWVPDSKGKMVDIVVGQGSIDGFVNSTEPFFGATIGRYANRIANGKFTLDGKTYSLPLNNGYNTLHGGTKGFHHQVWTAQKLGDTALQLEYESKDQEEGFPGNLKVKLIYTLTEENGLKMEYLATTDQKTVINLTNHAYFNLNGMGSGTILNHHLQILANHYTPVNENMIPTGNLDPVQGTPFDFLKPQEIGSRIDQNNIQLQYGNGYDHNFVLNFPGFEKPAATVIGDKTGIQLDIYTDQPGIQFYSGNYMASYNSLKGNHMDRFRSAFALETQHFPDSPNQPQFPSTVLNPGETYHTITIYSFHKAPRIIFANE